MLGTSLIGLVLSNPVSFVSQPFCYEVRRSSYVVRRFGVNPLMNSNANWPLNGFLWTVSCRAYQTASEQPSHPAEGKAWVVRWMGLMYQPTIRNRRQLWADPLHMSLEWTMWGMRWMKAMGRCEQATLQLVSYVLHRSSLLEVSHSVSQAGRHGSFLSFHPEQYCPFIISNSLTKTNCIARGVDTLADQTHWRASLVDSYTLYIRFVFMWAYGARERVIPDANPKSHRHTGFVFESLISHIFFAFILRHKAPA